MPSRDAWLPLDDTRLMHVTMTVQAKLNDICKPPIYEFPRLHRLLVGSTVQLVPADEIGRQHGEVIDVKSYNDLWGQLDLGDTVPSRPLLCGAQYERSATVTRISGFVPKSKAATIEISVLIKRRNPANWVEKLKMLARV